MTNMRVWNNSATSYNGPTTIGIGMTMDASSRADLVRYAGAAEAAGFDFEVMSDHYFPWLSAQGHAPYAWSVLGAVAQVGDPQDHLAGEVPGQVFPVLEVGDGAAVEHLAAFGVDCGLGEGC